MEPVNLGELDKLEQTYRRDLNCLKDLSRQRRLAALSKLTGLFECQVGTFSSNSQKNSSSLEFTPVARDACIHARGQHGNSIAAVPQGPAIPYYSRSSLSQFFLSHVYKPCVKLTSEDVSDDCREAAVNLLRSCVKDLLSADHIQGLVLGAKASPTHGGSSQVGGDTAESNVKDHGAIRGRDLILTLLNRLQGTPFNESSEEVRHGILDILLYLLCETASPAAVPLTARPPPFSESEEDSSLFVHHMQDQANGCSCVQQRKPMWQSATACTGSKDSRNSVVADKWSLELYAKATIRSVAHALSDTDARNVQMACLIAVAISERLSAGTLRKESEPLVSALLTKLRHPQRKTRWRVLDALQRLVGASQLPAMSMDKVVRALTALNYEETTSSNRDKLAEVVVHWFRRVPIRCMKRHVPGLLLLLLSCAADEESEALAKRAGRELCVSGCIVKFPRQTERIALPCLIQLEAQYLPRSHESTDELVAGTKHRKDDGIAGLETCTEACISIAYSTARERDEEADGETEGDADGDDDDDEDTAREVITVDDLELLERSWSAALASAYSVPEQSSGLHTLATSYASLRSVLPFPFCTSRGTTVMETFATSSEQEGRQHRQQQSCETAQQQSDPTGLGHRFGTTGEENVADPLRCPLDIARLAYMLRHVATELVQQALAEDSDFVASPARCCRSLRTLRLLAALLFASPTVAETSNFTVVSEELIRLTLLHLYKVCHHADALALQQSASVDGGARSRATTGSSSLVEYAFLVASSQVQIIRKEAEGDQQAVLAAPARSSIVEECNSRIYSRGGKSAEQDFLPSVGGAAPQRNCADLQGSVTISFGKKVALSHAQQTLQARGKNTPVEISTTGALKSCLQIVEEAQNCSATIAAVAAPHEWLTPLAEHVLGSDAELVRVYKQRVLVDMPQRSVKGEGEYNGTKEGGVRADFSTSAQSASRRLPDDKGRTWHQDRGSKDGTSHIDERRVDVKLVTAAFRSQEKVQSRNSARKNELCGRPQYAFLLLGSMLWTIRKKRKILGTQLPRISLTKVVEGDGAFGKSLASETGSPACNVTTDGYRCENIRGLDRQSKCKSLESSQWTADEARLCFGVIEQLVYPGGLHCNGENDGFSELPYESKPRSNGKPEVPSSVSDISNDTRSPRLLVTTSGTLLARIRQLPHEDDPVILLFATAVTPVLVDVCRVLCNAEWGRIFFVLIRLRVEHKASPLLVESALELLSIYSKKAPATLCRYFLSSWVSSEQQQLYLLTSSNKAESLSVSQITDCHSHGCDDGIPCSSKSSSFVDAWSLSDPRRLMLLYVFKRLRSSSPSPLSLDEGSECNTCPYVSFEHEHDAQLKIKQQPIGIHAHYVTQRQSSRETVEASFRESGPPAGPTADLTCDTTKAITSTDQYISAEETSLSIPHQGSNSGMHNFSEIGHWLPPLLKILARQASPEDVTPLVRVDVLECIFELLENPSTCLYCGRYGRFILEKAIKPNLQWRPGEANAKLRKAALACVDSIFASVATALANTKCDLHSLPSAADDFGMEFYDGGTFCDRVPEPSTPLPTHAKSPATNPTKVKLVSGARATRIGTPGLPTVQKAYKIMRVLVNLVESLLPCMLSCLEDDTQPDTRKLTVEFFTRFLLELEAWVRLAQQARSNSSEESAFLSISLAGKPVTACASERGTHRDPHPFDVAGSFTAAAEASRNPSVAGACQSPLSSDVGVSLQQANLPHQHGEATGSMQHEFLSFCSSLYPALLQRMDDARDTVRLAAAAALCSLLRFLRCLKAEHDCQQQQLVCGKPDGQGVAQQLLGVSKEIQEDRTQHRRVEHNVEDTECEGLQMGGKATADNVVSGVLHDLKKQEKKDETPSIFKAPQWRWPCLDYVVRGVMIFLDDQDESLAALVHEILRLAGDLNASLVLQEVQGVETRCIHLKRYEAVCEAIQGRSTHLTKL